MKPFSPPVSPLASASYAACRFGGAPRRACQVELDLPAETAARAGAAVPAPGGRRARTPCGPGSRGTGRMCARCWRGRLSGAGGAAAPMSAEAEDAAAMVARALSRRRAEGAAEVPARAPGAHRRRAGGDRGRPGGGRGGLSAGRRGGGARRALRFSEQIGGPGWDAPMIPRRAMRERLKMLEAREKGAGGGAGGRRRRRRERGAGAGAGRGVRQAAPRARASARRPIGARPAWTGWPRKGRITRAAEGGGRALWRVLPAGWIGAGDRLDPGGPAERRAGGGAVAGPHAEAGGRAAPGARRSWRAAPAAVRPVGPGDGLRPGLRPGTDAARGRRRRARGGADRGGAEGGAGHIGDAARGVGDGEKSAMFAICS